MSSAANENGGGRFAPLVAVERLKPAESRRSGLSAFRAGCEISGLALLHRFPSAGPFLDIGGRNGWLLAESPPSGYAPTMKITLDLPEDAFSSLRQAPDDFAAELRLAACVKWYELGRISQAKAAEISGLSRAAFIDALHTTTSLPSKPPRLTWS